MRARARSLTGVGFVTCVALAGLRFLDFDNVALLGIVAIAPAAVAASVIMFAATFGRRAVAVVTVGVLVVAGLSLPGTLLPRSGCDVAVGEPGDIVVLSHNALAENSNTGALARQIEDVSPDLVLLQEVPAQHFAALRTELDGVFAHHESHGLQHVMSTAPLSGRFLTGTSTGGALVVSADFETVSLRVANVHASAPVTAARRANQRTELEAMSEWSVAEHVELIMGDFNAGAAHFVYRDAIGARYSDAHRLAGCGTGLTWARIAGIPLLSIDHGLVDVSAFAVVSFEVLDSAGSDHKAIAVRLRSRTRLIDR